MGNGLLFDASSGAFGGGGLSLAVGGGNVKGKGRCIYSSRFRRLSMLDTLFCAFFPHLDFLLFHVFG